MRRLLPLFVLAMAGIAMAQVVTPFPAAKAERRLNAVMADGLNDPAVQVAIGVTRTQIQLQTVRLNAMATKLHFEMARTVAKLDEIGANKVIEDQWEMSPGQALYPFLLPSQVDRLRQLVVRNDPLAALATDDIAKRLDLSEDQRARIEAIRLARANAAVDPSRPSVKALKKGLEALAAIAPDPKGVVPEHGPDLKQVDKADKALAKLYVAWETAFRLAADEAPLDTADPRTLLTPEQLVRFCGLTGEAVAATKRRNLVAKRA